MEDMTRRELLKAGGGVFAAASVLGAHTADGRAPLERAENRPFGLEAVPVLEGALVEKWSKALSAIDDDLQRLASAERDPRARTRATDEFGRILAKAHVYTGRGMLGWLNQGVNLSIKAKNEPDDRWDPPLAALEKGGDCEEYALAKWLGLRKLGIAESDMRMVIVKLRAAPGEHAFLAVRQEDAWLILDNRRMGMVEDSVALREGRPLFMLGRQGVDRFAADAGTDAKT